MTAIDIIKEKLVGTYIDVEVFQPHGFYIYSVATDTTSYENILSAKVIDALHVLDSNYITLICELESQKIYVDLEIE